MKLRAYVTATVDPETAEVLEDEARQRKIGESALVRELLQEYAIKIRERKAQQATQQPSLVVRAS
jgi:hypothetical protein